MSVGIARRSFGDEDGQSLVEVALTLPLLLLIVIGIVDIGRVYAYALSTVNAAREAAVYAARHPEAIENDVCQRARDELGAGGAVAPCSTVPILIDCARGGVRCGSAANALYQTPGGGDVRVTVTYQVPLLTGYLVTRFVNVNPVPVSGVAALTGLSE
jgi:Flp pilus assembly protein TadG